MSKSDMKRFNVLQLFELYTNIMDELWQRGVSRSTNSPVADYAEHLVCKALKLKPARKSAKGFDATDTKGKRYEIKARRATKRSKPTRFSAIRDLESNHFDYLVSVLFAEDFRVMKAAKLTHSAVSRMAFWQKHVNGWILPLNDKLWSTKGVKDITRKLKRTQRRSGAASS